MVRARAALALLLVAAAWAGMVSGGSAADPRTPRGLPGLPPPFLGTSVVGDGALTAAIDAYGDVVDVRAPGPGGGALIDDPSARQAAGTVAADTGIVPRVRMRNGAPHPLWEADAVEQRYPTGTNAVRTVARVGRARVVETVAATRERLAVILNVVAPGGVEARPLLGIDVEPGLGCRRRLDGPRLVLLCRLGEPIRNGVVERTRLLVAHAAAADRRWLARALPLRSDAPPWARRTYRRSLLVLRALTDRGSGAVAAGARDGWAYVWPRDAAVVALALEAAGYRAEARRVARFLLALDLGAAARFDGDGRPVPGRGRQGDAAGWVAVAAREAGLSRSPRSTSWRDLPDYQEGSPGDYLGNAVATARTSAVGSGFATGHGLARERGNPASGLDSAAAWAVEPFELSRLYPQARKTMLRLARARGRFGITPGSAWRGDDPWSAPTAWTAWSLAALARRERDPARARADRLTALGLLTDLRRAATPAGALPERVDARTGVPRSTTPLAWSHAFVVLALRELWPTDSR